jgi:hypothetical protein
MARRHGTGWAVGGAVALCVACTACGVHSAAPTTTTRPARHGTTTTQPVLLTVPTPVGADITVSVMTASIGQSITISGTDCKFPRTVTGTIRAGIGGTGVETVPKRSGTWSVTLPIVRSSPLGPQEVGAQCDSVSPATNLWTYPPQVVDLTSTYSLSVQPGTTVTPGTTIYISSEGACPDPTPTSPDAYVVVWFGPSAAGSTYADRGQLPYVSTDGLGNWSTSFQVEGVDPGAYDLSAFCSGDQAVTNYYNPVTITVVAP